MNGDDHQGVPARLPAYLAQTLPREERDEVADHLDTCARCARELAEWNAVRAACVADEPPQPPATSALLRSVMARAVSDPLPVRSRMTVGLAWRLLVAQPALARRGLWLGSGVVAGLVLVSAVVDGDRAADLLAIVGPLLAAVGVSFFCGSARREDEAVLATPVSPRFLLLGRVVLVLGYNLVLSTAMSVPLALGGVHGLWGVVAGWLGPMMVLAALAFALSVWTGPNVAVTVATCCWVLRTLDRAVPLPERVLAWLEPVWATNAATLGGACVLVALALSLAPRTPVLRALPQ